VCLKAVLDPDSSVDRGTIDQHGLRGTSATLTTMSCEDKMQTQIVVAIGFPALKVCSILK
jgi:hypothetical protein